MNPHEEWSPYKDPKFCFVPACKNNSRDTQKTFFGVPKSTKQEWCDAVDIECPKRFLYICEDHLNLEEDMENYLFWKTVQGCPKLKSWVPQGLVKTSFQDLTLISEPRPSTTSASFMEVDVVASTTNKKSHKGVQVKQKTADRTTHCKIYKKNMQTPSLKEKEETTDTTTMEEALPSTQGFVTPENQMDTHYDQLDHMPSFTSKGQCRLCVKGQTKLICLKCQVRLCLVEDRNYFYNYHKK